MNNKILNDVFATKPEDYNNYFDSLETDFHDPFNKNEFTFYGTAVSDTHTYYRLSEKEIDLIKPISRDVPFLATHSAGIQLHFKTDSRLIRLIVAENDVFNMKNMNFMAQCGFDLYYYDEDAKQYLYHNSTTPNYIDVRKYVVNLGIFREKKMRDIIINFPLYCGVLSLQIGLEKGSVITASKIENTKRIVCYGTSILQGGCVSRPGLCLTNYLSRYFNQEVLNYGFSGAGLLEKEVGQIIFSRENTEMIIIDAEPNAGCERWMYDNFDNFLKEVYKNNENIPVVIMNKTFMTIDDYLLRNIRIKKFYDNFMKNLVRKYKKLGKKIYFVNNYKIFNGLSVDKSEFLVDGVHPNDLGMKELTKQYIKVIESVKTGTKK